MKSKFSLVWHKILHEALSKDHTHCSSSSSSNGSLQDKLARHYSIVNHPENSNCLIQGHTMGT